MGEMGMQTWQRRPIILFLVLLPFLTSPSPLHGIHRMHDLRYRAMLSCSLHGAVASRGGLSSVANGNTAVEIRGSDLCWQSLRLRRSAGVARPEEDARRDVGDETQYSSFCQLSVRQLAPCFAAPAQAYQCRAGANAQQPAACYIGLRNWCRAISGAGCRGSVRLRERHSLSWPIQPGRYAGIKGVSAMALKKDGKGSHSIGDAEDAVEYPRKKVKSPLTGRLIYVGGPAFQRIIDLGYIFVDDQLVHRNCVEQGPGGEYTILDNANASLARRSSTSGPPTSLEDEALSSVSDLLSDELREDGGPPLWWKQAGEAGDQDVSAEMSGDSEPIWQRWRDEQLRAIFDALKDDSGRVGLIQLRAALMEVQVPLSSELLWDMLHLADADGLVRLDYDMFVRLLTGVLESSMFRWGDSAVLPDSGKDAWVGGDTFGAGSGLYEMADGKLDDKSRGERGALGVGGVVEEEEQGGARGSLVNTETMNTQVYMELLNHQSINISAATRTNWDLMIDHHAGEWKGVWTCFSLQQQQASGMSLVSTEPIVLGWPTERRRVVSQVEPRPLRESIDYVDIDLGSWEQEDSEIEGLNMPSDIARSGSIVTGLHGFFDRVRTCRPVKLQRIHVGASYMWTCRRGPYWNAEAAVTVGDGWRVRLVAVYEDQRTEEGQPVAQLRSIISILERKGEFPPDMLDSLPFPFSLQASSQAVQDVPALGQWLGLAETVSEQPEETCPATGAESHMMVEWEGFTRMRDDTVQGGGWDGEYVACMENNSVFMLPGGAVLAAPRTIGLETEAQEGCKQVAVSMTWQVGSGLSVPKAQMTRVTRVLNANTVLAGAYGGGGSPAGGGEETSSSNPKRLDAANRFSKQTLEQFYLYNDLM